MTSPTWIFRSAGLSLAALLIIANPSQARPERQQVQLIVDSAVARIGGRTYPLPWEDISASASDDPGQARVSTASIISTGRVWSPMPALPPANNNSQIAGNALGGALGGVLASQMEEAWRQKSMIALKESLDPLEASRSFVAGLGEEAGRRGLDIDRTRIAEPKKKLLDIEFANGNARYVLSIKSLGRPMAGLSRDDRRPVVTAKFSLYERAGDGHQLVAEVDVVYLGTPALGEDPVAYWARDQAAPFRLELERAGRYMLAAFLDETPAFARVEPGQSGTSAADVGWRSSDLSHVRIRSQEGALLVLPVKDSPAAPPAPAAPGN